MLFSAHNLNHQTSVEESVFKSLVSSTMMLASFLSLGAIILSSQVHAAESLDIQSNLYTEKYVEQNSLNLKSLTQNPATQLELRNNIEEDNVRMLENGYDMIGSSAFVSTKIPAELARLHGEYIKADTVLVYNKNVPIKTKVLRLDGNQETTKSSDKENKFTQQSQQTIHYASYWAKLPMPLFGVHIIKLIPAENQGAAKVADVKGLTIIAVIKQSPAAKASILKGDNLLKIGEMTLDKPDDLFAAVKRYAGQNVPVELHRGAELIKMYVALNSRK